MTFVTIRNQIKRLRPPTDEFLIGWNESGQCTIRIADQTYRLNFKLSKMYRENDKIEFKDLIYITDVSKLRYFFGRHANKVMNTTTKSRTEEARLIEILFAYIANFIEVPLVYDVFVCRGVTKTTNGMVLKR